MTRPNELATSRGTVLVSSASAAFLEIVGYMVRRCGLRALASAAGESPSLSLTRTQACLVICDGDLPETAVSRMVAEVTARRIPLLVSTPYGGPDVHLAVLRDVPRISFPVGQVAFGLLVEELLDRKTAATGRIDP